MASWGNTEKQQEANFEGQGSGTPAGPETYAVPSGLYTCTSSWLSYSCQASPWALFVLVEFPDSLGTVPTAT